MKEKKAKRQPRDKNRAPFLNAIFSIVKAPIFSILMVFFSYFLTAFVGAYFAHSPGNGEKTAYIAIAVFMLMLCVLFGRLFFRRASNPFVELMSIMLLPAVLITAVWFFFPTNAVIVIDALPYMIISKLSAGADFAATDRLLAFFMAYPLFMWLGLLLRPRFEGKIYTVFLEDT